MKLFHKFPMRRRSLRTPKQMLSAMLLLTLGSLLCLGLASLLSSCRSDAPPKISETCVLDGLGGGDCSDPEHNHTYRPPSQMVDYLAMSPTDSANFTAWCYQTTPAQAQAGINAASR